MSISLSSGIADSSCASLISWFVVFPCADTTTATFFTSFFMLIIFSATTFNLMLSATEVPPNFNMTVFIFRHTFVILSY